MTEYGLLPIGVHPATLETVRDRFGSFQNTDRRCRLFERLAEFVTEIRGAGWNAALVLDGSFVMTQVDEPNDIDLILVLPEDWDLAAELKPFEYNLISKKRVRAKYGFDVFAVRANSTEYHEWVEFFSEIKTEWRSALSIPEGTKKGIVRVLP